MSDHTTPNLPSRNFEATSRFYGLLGFEETWRDAGWMILRRGELQLEFFPYAGLDPLSSSFGCCLRLDDLDGFYAGCLTAGLSERKTGMPRLGAPTMQGFGLRMGFMVDLDGTLIRLIENEDRGLGERVQATARTNTEILASPE